MEGTMWMRAKTPTFPHLISLLILDQPRIKVNRVDGRTLNHHDHSQLLLPTATFLASEPEHALDHATESACANFESKQRITQIKQRTSQIWREVLDKKKRPYLQGDTSCRSSRPEVRSRSVRSPVRNRGLTGCESHSRTRLCLLLEREARYSQVMRNIDGQRCMMGVVVLVIMGWGRLRQVLQEVDWHIVSSEGGYGCVV